MEQNKLRLFEDLNDAIKYIKMLEDDNVCIEISKESLITFTQNGKILADNLGINSDEKKQIIVFDGPNKNSKLILSSYRSVNSEIYFKNNWNWEVYFCLIKDDYYIINEEDLSSNTKVMSVNYTINGYNPLQWLHNILYRKLDWKSLKKNNINNNLEKENTLNQAIETALRVILIGNDVLLNNNNIYTEVDGEKIFCYDLKELALTIFYKMDCKSKLGVHKFTLFKFIDIQKKTKNKQHNYTEEGLTIDKIPLSYLLNNGLLDKLNEYFDTENSHLKIIYKHCKNKGEIIIEW